MSDDDNHARDAGTAPIPFSAAEIRGGCTAGRTVVGESEAMHVTWSDPQRHLGVEECLR